MQYDDTPEGKRRAEIMRSLGIAECAIHDLGAVGTLHGLAMSNALALSPIAGEFVEQGFKLFHAAQDADSADETIDLLAKAFGQLGAAIVSMGVEDFRNVAKQQASRMRPLAKIQEAKSAAVERAQAIAAELWQADTAQEIRLGDMADRVYRALVAEDFAESLPGSAERIKEWIKPASPEYARKGGRRRKTP